MMMILPMNESQETIAIPIAYLEALLMMFVAFLIGYIGATLYARFEAKRKAAQVALEKEELLAKISELKEDNERIPEDLLRKDRMDQELEQIQFQKRAFSEHVLTENANADKPKIDFKRIGIATATEKNDLQEIIGIG
ncbi:MAG: lipopolysaccharide export LptBFGC system permease protein LptF, partial [Flavobacteriales bacterium]